MKDDGWADSDLTAYGWGSRAGCTSGQGQCCIVPFTSNFNCAAEAEEAQYWGYTDQPAVPAAAAVPAGVTPAKPAVSSRDVMESRGSTEIAHCPMVDHDARKLSTVKSELKLTANFQLTSSA